MTAAIARRLEALEKRHGASAGPRTILLCWGVAPGVPKPEITRVRQMNGELSWTRQPDETEREFLDRAKREVPRSPGGSPCWCTTIDRRVRHTPAVHS